MTEVLWSLSEPSCTSCLCCNYRLKRFNQTVWKAVLLSEGLWLYHWLSSRIAKNGKTDQFFRKGWNPQIVFWTDKKLGSFFWRQQKKTLKAWYKSLRTWLRRNSVWSIILLFSICWFWKDILRRLLQYLNVLCWPQSLSMLSFSFCSKVFQNFLLF